MLKYSKGVGEILKKSNFIYIYKGRKCYCREEFTKIHLLVDHSKRSVSGSFKKNKTIKQR